MFRLILSLFRIAKEVRRIREILEIVHARELNIHYTPYDSSDEVFELSANVSPRLDPYGEPVDDEMTPEEEAAYLQGVAELSSNTTKIKRYGRSKKQKVKLPH